MKEEQLHARPFQGGNNNRKMTLCRYIQKKKVQSIPIYEKDEFGRNKKLLGYKYINH